MGEVGTNHIIERLREDGGRVTRSRRVIADVLLALDDHHLTAADIVEGVRRVDPTLHESTVYRTLERLTELGVVTTMATSDRAATYHVVGHEHLHLVCTDCGRVEHCPPGLLAPAARTALRDHGFEVTPSRSPLHGRCRTCREAAGR